MVPVNCRGYSFKPAKGASVFFERSSENPDVLTGPRPWVGFIENDKQVIRIWPDLPDRGKGRQTGGMFHKGQLLGYSRDGVDYVYAKGSPKFEDKLENLWPKKRARQTAKGSLGDSWNSERRFRLWYANPNSAGLLGAELALLFGALCFGAGMWRKVVGVTGVLAGIAIVAFSGSRGAIVATAVGSLAVLAPSGRKLLSRSGLITVISCIVLAVAVLMSAGQWKRIAGTFSYVDAGNSRRVKVGLASARMFADAPFGWRGGEVPGRKACLNWYVMDDKRVIRTHLLTMAELGWFVGFGYLFFWALMLHLAARSLRDGDRQTFAVWSSLAVAGFFNPVYKDLSLWYLPAGCMVWAAWRHGRSLFAMKNLKASVIGAGVFASLLVAAFALCGVWLNRGRQIPVKACGAAAIVNGAAPKVWVVEDCPVLGGWNDFPGRDILWQYAHNADMPPLGYVHDMADLPREVECLILPGRAAADYLKAYADDASRVCKAKRLLFLSPSVGPASVPPALLNTSDVLWLAGKFLSYRDDGYRRGLPWVRVLAGVEQYIPNWLSLAFGHFGYLAQVNQRQTSAKQLLKLNQQETKQ